MGFQDKVKAKIFENDDKFYPDNAVKALAYPSLPEQCWDKSAKKHIFCGSVWKLKNKQLGLFNHKVEFEFEFPFITLKM